MKVVSLSHPPAKFCLLRSSWLCRRYAIIEFQQHWLDVTMMSKFNSLCHGHQVDALCSSMERQQALKTLEKLFCSAVWQYNNEIIMALNGCMPGSSQKRSFGASATARTLCLFYQTTTGIRSRPLPSPWQRLCYSKWDFNWQWESFISIVIDCCQIVGCCWPIPIKLNSTESLCISL